MKPAPTVTDSDLNDYLDGRLSDERRREIEAWLRDHPEGAARLRVLRELDGQLRGLGAEILEQPVPERLRQAFQVRPSAGAPSAGSGPGRGRLRTRSPWLMHAAAACLMLVIGAAAGWFLRGQLNDAQSSELDQLLADASYTFNFYAADREHSIEFSPENLPEFATATSRLYDAAIEPPDLRPIGYTYRGARISPTGRRTGTFFFFESQDGSNIGLVFWPSEPMTTSGIGSTRIDDLSCWYWFVQGFGFALLGPPNLRQLDKIATELAAFYDDLLDSS
jgi:anti-sigma factor RsiW